MFTLNQKTKERIDAEIELYKAQKILETDKNIHERVVNNWKEVDDARRDRMASISEAQSELKMLAANAESIKKEIELLKNENRFLREIVSNYSRKVEVKS